jgi:hypothetical protein
MIDWQSYVDEEMPANERGEIDVKLANDPEVQRELDGFKAFQLSIRHAGYSVETPQMILSEMLSKVASTKTASTKNRLVPRFVFAAALLVALVFAFLRLSYDPMNLADSSTIASISVESGADAAAWIKERTSLDAPVISLASDSGKITKAKHGDDWGAFVFDFSGAEVVIAVARDDNFDEHGDAQQTPGMPLLFRGKGIGWHGRGGSFYLTGPADLCEAILPSLISQTWKPMPSAKSGLPVEHGRARAKMTR